MHHNLLRVAQDINELRVSQCVSALDRETTAASTFVVSWQSVALSRATHGISTASLGDFTSVGTPSLRTNNAIGDN